jgi:hypothetical protein
LAVLQSEESGQLLLGHAGMLAGGLEALADAHGLLLFHWHMSKVFLR